MSTCKYTNETFTRRQDQPMWTHEHPAIKDARAAVLEQHAGRYQHLYMSAIDRVLEAATPFALTDLDRLMAQAIQIAAVQEQEGRNVDRLSDAESEELNRKYAIYDRPEDDE